MFQSDGGGGVCGQNYNLKGEEGVGEGSSRWRAQQVLGPPVSDSREGRAPALNARPGWPGVDQSFPKKLHQMSSRVCPHSSPGFV